MLPAREKSALHPHLSEVNSLIVVLLVLQTQNPPHIVDYKSNLGPVPIEVVVAGVIFLVVFAVLLLYER